jgi:MarR family transcriptional regulator, organic hydroperoxide resistance regulator
VPRDAAVGARAQGDPIKKSDRLAHLTKEAWRSFTRALQPRLARHGVSFGHWTFLRILWRQDGLTQRELSDEAGVMEPSTFSALQAMEKLGYITRRRLGENRKNMYVHLTPKGRALRAKLEPLARQVNGLAVRGVPRHQVEATRATLLAIISNLESERP